MLFSAVVKDKRTNKYMILRNLEYNDKRECIKDIRNNGYSVNEIKCKPSNVFDYIINNTSCSPYDWRETNKIPE